jgi:signal transduction histidine kinase/DNA-binding response OmpR family regulator
MAAARPAPTAAAETNLVLDDLARDSLRTLLPVTLGLTWAWTSAVMIYDQRCVLFALALFALVLGSCWACISLRDRRLPLAVAVYLAGLGGAITLMALRAPGAGTFHVYLLLVLAAAAVAGPAIAWGVAAGAAALVLIIGRSAHLAPPADLASPILLILVTALMAYVSSRRLLTALGWALSMSERANRKAEEARERRAEARSILKSLDEAYLRLERANQALIFAREATERAYRFKAEFVANVSHELRTPLNLIVGFSEMMATAPESYKGRPLPSQYRGDVMAIYRSARHLSDLIDDVLDLSQIEAGRLPIVREETDLAEIIHEAADLIRGLAHAKGLQVIVDLPHPLPRLALDRTRIRQVLLNLLSNAARFTDEGYIRMRARLEGESVQVTVEDSGRGIAPERIAQAFEAFSRLDDDRARQGTGLGLAVSRRFVELHGGEMHIESVLGRGTTVGFALPVLAGRALAPGLVRTRPVADTPEAPPAVLVLLDDRHAFTLLRRHVQEFNLVQADTPERAVELLRQARPLAIVMEAGWRGRWAEIASAAGLAEPVPILTCPLPSLRQLGQLLGAGDYLAKPLRREDLQAVVARLGPPLRSVLVVDDDPSFARLLVRLLKAEDEGIEALMASGGAEGLAIARARRPDLVLLDLLMPGVSGYDFLAEVRGDPGLASMRVVVMSARSPELEARLQPGALQLERCGGLSLTEMVQGIQALLGVVTQPAVVAQASVAGVAATPPA